jgi:small subunit ribosomal protein S7
MKDSFPDIVDYQYTAQMEEKLDDIETGKETLESTLGAFYEDFSRELENAESTVKPGAYELPVEETDYICENCGAKMIVKSGRFGKFIACPNYPTCRNTKQIGKPEKETVKEAEPEEKAPLEIWKEALEKITPQVEVKSRRVGGATFQVPTEIRPDRKEAISMKNMIIFARKRGGKTMADKLAAEIIDAYNEQGGAFKRKEDMHRMAEANRAFAHFRF